ncbi:adenylate kinase [bacterium]|jgi:adenylate kinase|nr:adenylate kinase [bacterium]MBT3903964.1 adenylate kinase [bacterium]MBT4577796.1 adenylate kinase [bacterium]MBT5346095.1 adenylate kinase [bacterium]MBT6131364.1 adenylate kinase [bacterium]
MQSDQLQRDLQKIIVLVGPPGSGKGTLAQRMLERCSYCHVSTGNLCRDHLNRQTEVGKKIAFAMNSGKLVADSLIVQMVKDFFDHRKEHDIPVILDGCPRTIEQARMLTQMLGETAVFRIIWLKLSDDDIVRRIVNRVICSNSKCAQVYSLLEGTAKSRVMNACDKCDGLLLHRDDDKEDIVRQRLLDYHKNEREIIEFYRNTGAEVEGFDASVLVDQIFDSVTRHLGCL